jgi:hypothetical protein
VFTNNIAFKNGRPGGDDRPGLVVEGEQWELMATHNNWAGEPGVNTRVVGVLLSGNGGQIYTSDEINHGAFQTGNISAAPLFVDPAVPDVRLQPGSPCIDAGKDVGLPYLGPAPDMGAVEFDS